MGLSYYYEFTAPANTPADDLEAFLHDVDRQARLLGFEPTTVLNVPFDTSERRQLAHRLGASFAIQDERLKGIAVPEPNQLRDHDPISGECRVNPERGVVLVVTDEQGCEACFGFFQFPEHIIDIHGAVLAATRLERRWWFRDFVDSPDSRYRAIVATFEERGFVKAVKDDFALQ